MSHARRRRAGFAGSVRSQYEIFSHFVCVLGDDAPTDKNLVTIDLSCACSAGSWVLRLTIE